MANLDYSIFQDVNSSLGLGRVLDYYQVHGLYDSKHDYQKNLITCLIFLGCLIFRSISFTIIVLCEACRALKIPLLTEN